MCCYRWLVQARSPELHRNKSLTVFSWDVVRCVWGGGLFGAVWGFREGRCDLSSGLSQPGGKSCWAVWRSGLWYSGTVYNIHVYSITLPLDPRITRNFLHVYIFNHSVWFISLFHPGDLKHIPIRLELTGITIRVGTFGPHNVGNTSTQTHTAPVCILFSMIELLLYTVHSNLNSVSAVPTLPPCIFLEILCNPFYIHVRKYVH